MITLMVSLDQFLVGSAKCKNPKLSIRSNSITDCIAVKSLLILFRNPDTNLQELAKAWKSLLQYYILMHFFFFLQKDGDMEKMTNVC